ncbi:hypothetical protein LOTGIDRAFT_234433 [Lottia gigantea]|uniref:Cysteine and tyrosine-rich protein 1 n=1 Tax=Lottia gigantea TaxID=225164 RepID=V4A6J7_LOTGI|nr:hypothetical protein LOTGIDRAFT_234433 [Lottia gigantea]ESO88876.1 hypothetical protein LOTGIDRAFT_234433 [Lottia gigantea]
MKMKLLAALVLLNLFSGTLASICYYTSFGVSSSKYCAYGCCGSTFSTVCCNTYISVGVVAGSVIGGICALAVVIAILIIICRRRRGTIVYQSHGCHDPHVTTVPGTTVYNSPPPYRY